MSEKGYGKANELRMNAVNAFKMLDIPGVDSQEKIRLFNTFWNGFQERVEETKKDFWMGMLFEMDKAKKFMRKLIATLLTMIGGVIAIAWVIALGVKLIFA